MQKKDKDKPENSAFRGEDMSHPRAARQKEMKKQLLWGAGGQERHKFQIPNILHVVNQHQSRKPTGFVYSKIGTGWNPKMRVGLQSQITGQMVTRQSVQGAQTSNSRGWDRSVWKF